MNQFDNIRFVVPANADDDNDNFWEYWEYEWNQDGNQVAFNEETHCQLLNPRQNNLNF